MQFRIVERERERQTDRQRERETDRDRQRQRQRQRQTETETDRETERQRQTYRQIHRQTDRQRNRQRDRSSKPGPPIAICMDGWTHGRLHIEPLRAIHAQTHTRTSLMCSQGGECVCVHLLRTTGK